MGKITKLFVIMMILLSVFGYAETIKYGGQYYPGEFLLQGYDFFSQFDIEVDHILFSSGTENNIALISGGVDINVGSDSKTVALFNAIGDQALIIGVIQRGDRYSTIVRDDSPYQSWEDLKGKKVGTRFGTGAEFVLRKYFDSKENLSWNDFQWINLSPEDMVATLASGQIEAFTVWSPTGEVAVSQGIGRILRSFGDVALTPVQIHTTRKYAENHREELVKFLAAHLEKAKMIKENPELAAQYAAQAAKDRGIEITVDAFELIFKRIDFSLDYDESLINELKETAQFLKDQNKIREIPEFSYDRSFLLEAMELVNEKENQTK
ncbi:MAG: ABC transporter substrate-binding protein [Petrotogales bacterium]